MRNSRINEEESPGEDQAQLVINLLAEYSPKLARINFEFKKKRLRTYYAFGAAYVVLFVTWYMIDRISIAFHLKTLDEIMAMTPTFAFFVTGLFFLQNQFRESKMQRDEISRILYALTMIYDRAVSMRDAMGGSKGSTANDLRMVEYDLRILEAEVIIREARDIASDQKVSEINLSVPPN